MAGNETYRIEIPIIIDDQSEAPLSKARERVNKFEQSAQKANQKIQKMAMTDYKLRLSVLDRAMPIIEKTGRSIKSLTSRAWTVTLTAKDRISGVLHGIKGVFGRFMGALTSPLALLGIGGGIAGVTGAGLKMVMEEQDMVSAFQVMLGSREAAEKRMRDLISFAGQTPYTRQEVWAASRQLELFTGGALSTGEGLQMVGDIAAGTIQPFEDVAMWVGRLYDGLKSGRPIGEAAMRLQEMGALSGESRAKLEKLAESGMDISKIWPLAAKEFDRFNGLMEMQSKNLKNIVLGTKTFFTENVIKKWGQGVADAIQPALTRFREWRKENEETVKQIGETIERFGRKVGDRLVGFFERAGRRISQIMSDPKFEQATFSEKILMLVKAGLEDVNTWLQGPGGELISKTIKTMGELLGMGIEELIPVLVPPAVKLGLEIGKGLAQGIEEAIESNPIAAMIIGGYIGSKIPGVGPIWGAGGGFLAWSIGQIDEERIFTGGRRTRQADRVRARTIKQNAAAVSALGLRLESTTEWEKTYNRYFMGEGTFVPVTTPVMAGEANINLNFDLSGLVDQVIIENREDIDGAVDEITETIAKNLRRVFHNTPR